MQLLKRKLREEESRALGELALNHASVSGRNLEALGAGSQEMRDWMRAMHNCRQAQTVLLQLITNTGCKIFGAQLQCYNCKTALNLQHVLCDCPLLERPREDGAAYLGLMPATALTQYKTSEKLLPTFCMAAMEEISLLLKKSAEQIRGPPPDQAGRRDPPTAPIPRTTE